MAITNDGKLLIATALDRLSFYDVNLLTNGAPNPLVGTLRADGAPPGYFQVTVKSDDRYLFVSDHNRESISVINLTDARASGFSAATSVRKIPVGYGAVSLSFSPDGRYLYTTTQIAHESWHWPNECRPESAKTADVAPNHARGAVVVIDVRRAIEDPSHSVIATVPAGCDPVRLALTAAGDRAFVTARSGNELLAFDAHRLATDSARALIGTVSLRTGPVGIAVIDRARQVVVTNSTRFAGGSTDIESLTVINMDGFASSRAIAGTIPAAAGPLELRTTADGRTLLLTNYAARTLQLIDLSRVRFTPTSP